MSYVVLVLGGVLLVDGIVGDNGLLEALAAKRKSEQIEASVAKVRIENAKLREEARLLREDPATIEGIARRELGLLRAGERLFVIRDVSSHRHD